MAFSKVSLLLSAASVSLAQFVTRPTTLKDATGFLDLPVRYKQVPTGICELDPKVKSYSGYVDVAQNEHIFFWFFEARTVDPSKAPLTVWINGGPGSSSMIGLFEEHGPCMVDSEGKVHNNTFSWSSVSNMIYIDQPTQTGLSYSIHVNGYVDNETGLIATLPGIECPDFAQVSNSCGTYSYPNRSLTAESTAGAAPNFWKTLQGFMGAFPKYSRSGFNLASESYGGHYAPVFSQYIKEQNAKNIAGAHNMSLDTVLIGNGWFDPVVQYASYYNFTVEPGNTYDLEPLTAEVAAQMYNNLHGAGNCLDQIQDCQDRGLNTICLAADQFCANSVETLLDSTGRNDLDIRQIKPDPFPYKYYTSYLNSDHVQLAIGAYVNFSTYSNVVNAAFQMTGDDGREYGTVEALRQLVDQGVTVMLYAGDADYNCNWFGNEVVAENVEAPGFDRAGYVDLKTSDGKVHGQVKQAGHFSFVRVYDAGHEVAFYQPLAALEIFERAINQRDIATGLQDPGDGYLTKGTIKSNYRQGSSSVKFDILPANSTYDPVTGSPFLPSSMAG